jgi:amidase
MTNPLASLDVHGQAELLGRGEVSALELVDAAIERIERLDPELNAVILPAFERARSEARELGAARPSAERPFLGVPFLMKDLGGAEAGAPYHAGMRLLKEAGYRESQESHLVGHLRRAGLVLLGRTNTPELGLLPTTEPEAFGATRNPWSLEHSSGGSQAHARALLLRTRARRALGGVLVRAGRHPQRTRHRGAARPAGRTHAGRPVRGRLRIGVLAGSPREGLEVHPACSEAAGIAARALEILGHAVEESHPDAYADSEAVRSYVTVVACNTARAIESASELVGRKAQAKDVEPLTWALAESGWQTSATQYLATLELVHALGRRTAAWWEQGFDLLVTPTAAEPPPRLGQMLSTPEEPVRAFFRAAPFGAFTSLFNQTGQPAVSLPLHETAEGLPVGVQLVAASGREDLLLRVASQLEAAVPWSERRPALFA